MPVVKLYANLRKPVGTKELSLTGATVRAALNELVQQNPPLGEVILENGKLGPHVVVTLNGHNVIDLDTLITEQDVIAIFPPITGGQPSPPVPSPLGKRRRNECPGGSKKYWI